MCFFRLVVTTAVLVWAVNRLGWLKRLCQHALKLGLASGGLVLTCSVMDMGATLLGYTTALLVELTEPQIKLAILGGATAFLLVIAAPEGGSSNRVLHENLVIFSLHPPRSASSSPLAIHQEAGRLRRRVAATLFFRVFDPGGLLCFISSCFLPSVSFYRASTTRVCVTHALCTIPSQHMRTPMPCLVIMG